MRICFILNSDDNFNPNAGGVQRISRILDSEFILNGIEVYYLSIKNDDFDAKYKKYYFE